jgi:hypothetical protein
MAETEILAFWGNCGEFAISARLSPTQASLDRPRAPARAGRGGVSIASASAREASASRQVAWRV